jgi:hypothetical protein
MDGLHQAVRTHYLEKSNDELLQIWVENNRDRYSPAAFQVIGDILGKRGVRLPPQGSPAPYVMEYKPAEHLAGDPWNRLIRWMVAMIDAVAEECVSIAWTIRVFGGFPFPSQRFTLGSGIWSVSNLALPLIELACGVALFRRRRFTRYMVLGYLCCSLVAGMLRVSLASPGVLSIGNLWSVPSFVKTWLINPLIIPVLMTLLVTARPVKEILEGSPRGFEVK